MDFIHEDDIAIRIKIFCVEFVIAKRNMREGERRIQLDIYKDFFKRLFSRIKGWFNNLFGSNEVEED